MVMPLASMPHTKHLYRYGSWDGQFIGFKDALRCLRCHLQRQNGTHLVCHCDVGILFTKFTKIPGNMSAKWVRQLHLVQPGLYSDIFGTGSVFSMKLERQHFRELPEK